MAFVSFETTGAMMAAFSVPVSRYFEYIATSRAGEEGCFNDRAGICAVLQTYLVPHE
jgi:hypothetical protein